MAQGHAGAARGRRRRGIGARLSVVLLIGLVLATIAEEASARPTTSAAPTARAAREPDGTWLETPDGLHWRVVGGSVLPVSNMTLLGFPPGGGPIWIPVADLSEYAAHPADGTVIAQYGPQMGLPPVLRRFAGGALFPIPDGSAALAPIAVDSPSPSEGHATWGLRARFSPLDGTFLTARPTGRVLRVVGGAPLIVDDWAAIGGPFPSVEIPDAIVEPTASFPWSNVFAPAPQNGTTVTALPSGRIYRFVSGAPLRVDDWSVLGGPQPTIAIPDTALTSATNHSDGRVSQFPLIGGVVARPSGRHYFFVGGAPLRVLDWRDFSTTTTVVDPATLPEVPDTALDARTNLSDGHVLQHPHDGWPVHVRTIPSGAYGQFTFVGGAALPGLQCPTTIADCCPGATTASSLCTSWTVAASALDATTSYSDGHVAPCPIDGTVLRGSPSGDLWEIHGCRPVPTDDATGAWVVDDAVIAGIHPPAPPVDPPASPTDPRAGDDPIVSTPLPPITPTTPLRTGYWMVDATGEVYGFGDARDAGDDVAVLAGTGAEAIDLEPTPSGDGYWILDSRGHVTAHGDAVHRGNVLAGELVDDERATSISATPSGKGYWIFTDRGRVVALGDAVHRGDVAQTALNGPVLDSIATPTGDGYYMVASDGGVFAFGDAAFLGSMGATRLNAPVQSLVPDPDGDGYWLVASDGGIFAFAADFHGSMGATPLNRPITGMIAAGTGYLMVGEDGGIFAFGGAPFLGSLGDHPPDAPVTAVASL
jgi:hypothetical protein